VARPPLGHDRLEERPDGRLALRLKTRWRDGTTHILMERRDLLDRLIPLIPPPRAHQVRYHGILAPGASLREHVVPAHAEETAPGAVERSRPARDRVDDGAGPSPEPPSQPAASDRRSPAHRMRWAALLQRVFAIDALRCPRCGSTLHLIATIEDPVVARAILECMELPARAPPATVASPEPHGPSPSVDKAAAFDFDQTSAYEEC
jgi:hypothetical protein